MALQPFDGEIDPLDTPSPAGGGLKPFTGALDSEKPEQNKSLIGDLGTDLKRGVQQLPGVVTGLADVGVGALTGRRVVDETADKIGEATGFQPSKWQEEARQEYSPQRQQGTAEIEQAWEEGDALDIAGAYASNPGNVAGLVAESLPQMLAGGAIGRGALVGGRAAGLIANPATAGQAARQAIAAGAGGEGAVIAGGTMDQIDREVDPRRAALASAGAGVAGAALSGFGARLAQRAGLIDVESALAGGVGQVAGKSPGLARRVAGGALTEGVLEELPQSVQEQMLQNWAEQKPLMEGVPRAAVEGTLAGSAIGGAVNVARRPSEQMGLDPAAGPLSAAAATAVDGAPTGSQTPVQDAVRQSMLSGAPDTQPGGRYEPISQQLAIAQELFPADLDENGNLRFYRYDRDLQTMVEVPEAQALDAAKRQLDTWAEQGFDPQDPRGLDELVPQVDELPAQPPLATVESDTGPQPVEQVEQPLPLPTVESDTGPMQAEQVQPTPVAGDPNFEIRVQKNGRPFRGERDVRLLGLFNQLQREGQSPIIVPHEGGWAVAVPREPVPPPAPLGLPAPSTMVVDSQGNAQRGVTAPFVEPTAQVRPIGGPGMERQAPAARRPVTDVSRDNGRDSGVTFARDLQGEDLGSGWVGFNQQSGSLGVPRADMPQIRADHRGAMVNFMSARGVTHEEQTVPARSLRPTQAEFSPERVGRAAAREGTERSILVSGDGYVLDGHHQWLAQREAGGDVKIIRLNAPMADLLPLAREFPSSFTDQASQEVQGADSRPGTVDDRAAGDTPAVPDAADNVAREPVVAERPEAAGRSAGSGRSGVPAATQGADGQRALSEQPAADQAATNAEAAPVQTDGQAPALPEILAMPRKRYIDRQAKATGIKKGSPGYEQAIQRLQDQYEADVDRASAGITFEQYNDLNSDSPEGVNRQAWEALRQEFGQQQYSRNSYRRSPEPGQSARAGQLRMQLKRLTGAWQNAPDVKVVQSIKDLPERQRRQVERDGAFDVEGIFADGQVYLVADNLRDAQHAAFVLQHEVLGHAGLQGAYGQRLTPLLMSIYNGNADMKAQADELVRRFGYKPAVAMEEVLADMAGAGTIQQQAFWPRLVTAMRNALRSIGFNMRWTEGDIQGLLANARAYIENGRRRAGTREAFSRDGRSGRGPEIADEQGRLLAPNGKPSKLTQRQWHQARSENFKRWFGNWQGLVTENRLAAMTPINVRVPADWRGASIQELQAKVAAAMDSMVRSRTEITHPEIGMIRVGRKGADKTVSTSRDPAKMLVSNDIQSIMPKTIHSRFQLPNKPKQGVDGYSTLLAPINVDGVQLVAMITIEHQANGDWYYNSVAVTEKGKGRDSYGSPGTPERSLGETPITGLSEFVRRELERVNPETVSKVTDGNGEPLVLYHGTAEQFTIFDQSRPGRSTGHTTAPLGVFLTNDGTLAKAYAEKATDGMPGLANVMPLFASIKNPYRMSVAESQRLDTFEKALEMRQRLEREGYDGIQLGDTGTWVAFYNNQVKSATNNTGAFDQVDPDIRYRRAEMGMPGVLDRVAGRFGQGQTDASDPFAEENRRLREQDKTLWNKAKLQFRRQFAPGGLLPDAVFAEKIKRDSEFQAVEFDVRHLAGGLEQAVKTDFGTSIDKLSPDQMKVLANGLAGKVDPSLPEGTRTALIAMRQYIDSLSGEYIGILQRQVEDKLQGADPALIEKITSNLGSYVHRSYQAFDDPKWYQQVPTETVNAARRYLAEGYRSQGADMVEANRLADVAVNEMLKNGTAYDSMDSFIAEGKLGAKDLSVMIKRKEIAPEIRALLGEYTDPRLNFAKSATKMGRLIWNQRFLDQVRASGMGAFLFEGKDRPASATVQIAGEESDTYAPLNGLWTFPEVAQAFKDSMGKEQMSDLYRTIVRLNGMVKYGKTVLSPTTAMRNWQSAMFFSLANGHFDMSQMRKSWAAFREQVTQNATGDDRAYLRKLKQLGVVYDTPYAGEMMALLQDARMDELLSGKSGTGIKWLRQINQVAQGFYSFGDDFWKIIGFENEKASLIKAGIPQAQAEQMAAERIRNTYPTYSMIGKGIQWLRRFPLAGTFVSFPAEIVRTSVNMLRLTAADLKSDNPGLQAIGRKRAVGMAMVSAGFYALSAMTAAAFGVGDDEEEAIRDLAPPWQRNSTFLFTGRDADGKLRYFDMSFLDPYGYWKRPLTAMLRDQPWEKAATSALGDMIEPFLGTDITAGALFEVMANKKGSGGQVYLENAGPVDQTLAIADHLRKALQPGFVSNAERLTLAAQGVRREGSGQPYDMRDELVSLLGWRASTLDTQTALYYRSFEFTDALSDARKVLSRTLRSSNKVSDGDIRSARETAQAQYQQAFTQMGRLVSSARAAGMNNQQIAQTLKLSGVSQVNVMALLNGRVPPMNTGNQGLDRAIRQARLMQGAEHAQEIARRFAIARQQ
ncbi:hypothetical protein EGJ23_01705 [Pseudomonas sp. o96-267]|uniref:ADP-ribosyltransferase-containing protein n=1 Tax=Pseudomonas sp. o96-267 TaxID=2479853 RepID=UPI000F76D3F1|nr:hypothetical protein [Pseudomonas sp. o96-267]RRV29679.1 hypothetical protein EGJ23_01705 [Pseudomonas sp. o96-267]